MATKLCLVEAIVFPVVMYGYESWTIRKLSVKESMLLNCGVREDSWESLGLQEDQNSQSKVKSVLNIHWKDWCWSSNTLTIWCEELTHLKRPWCWKRLKAGREGDYKGWDGWMASPTQRTWVWANPRSWWWTGKPSVLQSMGSQESDTTEQLNWYTFKLLTNIRVMKKYLINFTT